MCGGPRSCGCRKRVRALTRIKPYRGVSRGRRRGGKVFSNICFLRDPSAVSRPAAPSFARRTKNFSPYHQLPYNIDAILLRKSRESRVIRYYLWIKRPAAKARAEKSPGNKYSAPDVGTAQVLALYFYFFSIPEKSDVIRVGRKSQIARGDARVKNNEKSSVACAGG